jgi:hypothetical protein
MKTYNYYIMQTYMRNKIVVKDVVYWELLSIRKENIIMSLIDLQSQVKSQLIMYEDIIKRLSKEFNIDEILLQRLCKDINIKTSNSYAMTLNIIFTDLSNGLDINKIILKYNLDKDLI